jgi:SAM-dependent methyltransferase
MPITNWEPRNLEPLKEYRDQLRPLSQQAVAKHLVAPLTRQGKVLEVGAGAGELRDLVGETLPHQIDWVETDPNPRMLETQRKHPTKKQVVALPEFPFDDESVDAVVGFSVFDVLTYPALETSLSQFHRALKKGGRVFHFLDVYPGPYPEFSLARENGHYLFPLVAQQSPYDVNGLTGLYHVDPAALRSGVSEFRSSRSLNVRMVCQFTETFLANPERFTDYLETSWTKDRGDIEEIFLKLPEAFKVFSAIRRTIPDYPAHLHTQWESLAKKAGFKIDYSGRITETTTAPVSAFPGINPRCNRLDLFQGETLFVEDPALGPARGTLKLCATMYLFVAVKE